MVDVRVSLCLLEICLATIGVCVFSALTAVGALFYFIGGKTMKRKLTIFLLLVSVVLLALVLAGCADIHIHKYNDATCNQPKTCSCGETSGESLGHDYADADCTTPRICKRCGARAGQSLGHAYTGTPSCTEPQTCSRCGQSGGTVLGHDYSDATCYEPKRCGRCGVIAGTALGHSYSNASCTSPQICIRCGETQGAPLGHDFWEADCESPKRCKRCDKTEGAPLGHHYADDVCIRCGQVDPDTLPVKLESLPLVNSQSYTVDTNVFTDTYGDTYYGSSIYSSASWYNGGSISVYNTRKEFTKFRGSFVGGQGMEGIATIDVFVDNVDKYHFDNYTRETGKLDFEIDVSNASLIKIHIIYVRSTGAYDVRLVNAELYR